MDDSGRRRKRLELRGMRERKVMERNVGVCVCTINQPLFQSSSEIRVSGDNYSFCLCFPFLCDNLLYNMIGKSFRYLVIVSESDVL